MSKISATPSGGDPKLPLPVTITALPAQSLSVGLAASRPDPAGQPGVAFFQLIRRGAQAIDYPAYEKFVQTALCENPPEFGVSRGTRGVLRWNEGPFSGLRAYEHLRDLTEVFVMSQAAVVWPARSVTTADGDGVSNKDPGNEKFDFSEQEARTASIRFGGADTLTKDELNAHKVVVEAEPAAEGSVALNAIPFLAAIRKSHSGIGIKNGVAGDTTCSGLLRHRLESPLLIELIWSYWMEQAMLVQSLAAISLRFQNRSLGQSDPLARMEITPLRPMTNLLWGYIQREPERLTVQRRALEYQHAYGLTLSGRAVPPVMVADPRPRFLESFHALLREADRFYRAQANTIMRPDAFRALNSLKELHLILAEGMHNQYGDLPSTARVEMLVQQFLIARPEMRDFLGGRSSIPYPSGQTWMAHLESIRQSFGWADASVRHYYELATFGEQILLSVRFWNWSDATDQSAAEAWLTFWKPEIQSYIHAYRAVTGIDLAVEDVRPMRQDAIAAQPSDLIARRRAAVSVRR
jgi:hypothetical protein